ncbi:hypothetical protein ABKN59_001856 [Abortiporus biennis]
MFSQWRHAVESLAQHSPKASQDSTAEEQAGRSSIDSTLRQSLSSSSQLAESALSNLRKTLVAQRPASPSLGKTASTNDSPTRPPGSRTTLEDRLRAKFTIGDASAGPSPSASSKTSRVSTPVTDHPLSPSPSLGSDHPPKPDRECPPSPRTVPLPDSPLLTPTIEAPLPVEAMPSLPSVLNEETDPTNNDRSLTASPISQISLLPQETPETTQQSQSEASITTLETVLSDSSSSQDELPATSEKPQINGYLGSTEGIESTPPVDIPSVETVQIAPDSSDEVLPIPNGTHDAQETSKPQDPDIDSLQKRLKLVEQRFADVSTSFKRLQAEKAAADKILRELTSVESVQEADSLRDYLTNMNLKVEISQDEIKRLNGKLTRQEERIEELRDIHRLESKSQTEQIDKLRLQLSESESLITAFQAASQHAEEDGAKKDKEIEKLRAEVDKVKGTSKEEEEKRVKAVSLLKSVRQKLVKAEKERDDAQKELHTFKEKEKEEKEKDKNERQRLTNEIEKVNAERETAVQGLRAQFEKEIAALKDKQEKDIAALRGQYELEAVTTKASFTRDLETKATRISQLEETVQTLKSEKDDLFDQLQMRQAELESSQSHLESLQSQTTELEYQLREANEQLSLYREELAEARRTDGLQQVASGPSPEEVTKLLSAAETKFEMRLADARRQIAVVERERDEAEVEWSRKFEPSQESKKQETKVVKLEEAESNVKSQLADAHARNAAIQHQFEEAKSREAQMKAHNKTLRDELRKVQSSAALLERQRNPGVGYFAARQETTSSETRSPRSSMSDIATPSTPPVPDTPSTATAATKSDEDLNFEYLRNVIMQFLEHKEMRPHLIRILSTILRFTPQETRRLISKVN